MSLKHARPKRATGHHGSEGRSPRGGGSTVAHRVLRRIGAPYPPYAALVVRDGTVIWIGVRLTFAAAFLVVGLGEVALRPPWTISAALIAMTTGLVWLDRRRRHELLLPANLGTRGIWFVCTSMVGGALLDVVSRVVLATR